MCVVCVIAVTVAARLHVFVLLIRASSPKPCPGPKIIDSDRY